MGSNGSQTLLTLTLMIRPACFVTQGTHIDAPKINQSHEVALIVGTALRHAPISAVPVSSLSVKK